MSPAREIQHLLLAGLALALCVAPPMGLAANPPPTRLEGLPDEAAHATLSQGGYQFRKASNTWSRKVDYWWNDGIRQCLRVASRNRTVTQVDVASSADCDVRTPGVRPAPAKAQALNAADLQGLSRKAAEAKLTQAGFNSLNVDESKPEATYMQWVNLKTGQCLAVTMVNDRYDLVANQPARECR